MMRPLPSVVPFVLALASCTSPTRQIGDASAHTSVLAREAISSLQEASAQVTEAGTLVEESLPAQTDPITANNLSAAASYLHSASSALATVSERLSAITTEQTVITQALPSVQDRESGFIKALRLLAWIIAPIGLCFLLWYTGVGFILKRILWSFGLLIPKADLTSAQFDVEQVEAGTASPGRREAIAARRGSSPSYNAAFQKIKKDLRLSKKPASPPTPSE